MNRTMAAATALAALLALAACSSSHFDPPDPQGPAALVDDAGAKRLWLLSKQEEERQVSFGSTRRGGGWRTDTFFHFRLQAIDPATARPLWTRTLVTYGDADAAGSQSEVIGSAVDARLLGQEGDVVWLRIDATPYAVDAATGEVIGDGAAIEAANPALAGLLPREAKFLGFDRGLAFTAADAQPWVVRGRDLKAEPWVPTPPPPAPPPRMKANGMPYIVPMEPALGPVPLRNVERDDGWLGLYTDNEAADAGDDSRGDNYAYPYSIADDGALARRRFWRFQVVDAQSFDERFRRLQDPQPVQGSPSFLNGRLQKDPLQPTRPLAMAAPSGLLVWHRTRIDHEGRLALTRIGDDLQPLWQAELPLDEASFVSPVQTWVIDGRVLAVGDSTTFEPGGPQTAELVVVSVDLADGRISAWNLATESAVP